MNQPASEMETKLRMLMDIAAGEPSRPVTLEAVRRGVMRRRKMTSAAAVAAMVLVGSVGVAVAAQRVEPGHGPTGPTVPARPAGGDHSQSVAVSQHAGVPRYYVVHGLIPNNGSTPNRPTTTVRATATGATRVRVRCPVTAPSVISWPVAVAGNQTFFLVCQKATGPQSYAGVVESRIFQFRVTSSGRASAYVPVRGGVLSGLLVHSIAVTPDGSEIAAIVYPGKHPPDLHRTPPDVVVINTRTGTQTIWRGARPVSGQTVYWPQDISLTADGQKLVFLTMPQCFQAGCTTHGGQQMRVISHPGNGGGQLNSAPVLVRLYAVLRLSSATVMDGVISPDGSALTLAVMGALTGQPRLDTVSIVQIPATGQRKLRFIYRNSNGDSYSFFSADSSGRHFLLGIGSPQLGPVNGRIDNGRLIPLRPGANTVLSMVW
jgi:hypothetical protein